MVETEVHLGPPRATHASGIHALVRASGSLDVNSLYAYLLLCEHFADSCIRAESGGRTVGFVSAYRPPTRPDVLFVWQVATASHMRRRGLARKMLHALLGRIALRECRYLEATVSPSNEASRRLFHGIARDLKAPAAEHLLFAKDHFGDEQHEEEVLIQIGPFGGKTNQHGSSA